MKNLVLCSDGTGNKGGYGADSNVYKTYKAVDIHNPAIVQLTFYDNGVGTDKSDNSKNKYLTALSGAFGFGFAANVRDLYDFLARSYDVGDAVFLFGFSRGAATVRAFTGFLHFCGLLDRNHPDIQIGGVFDEDKFRAKISEAFELYQAKDKIRQQAFKERYAVKDADHAPDGNLKIKFIGVWDTVSALGFPQDFSKAVEWLFKLADEISDKIWPHQFYYYKLNNAIENAYQALAIDDERTTFHPKVWNEHRTVGYVEQVWFAGVHSNVGGGYPRTGMSDVALAWMMDKAEAHGLVFYDDNKLAVLESANVDDKLYDSRDGVGIYYRYGPRNLRQLCHSDKGVYKLKDNIKIHRSAYERIKAFSAGYAPDGLPDSFDIVDVDPANPALAKVVKPVAATNATLWASLTEQMSKQIANRAGLYRAFVEATMLILVLAGYLWIDPPVVVENLKAAADGGILAHVADFLIYFTPVFFENFIIYVVRVQPWIVVAMLATLYAMSKLRNRYINQLDAITRAMCNLLS